MLITLVELISSFSQAHALKVIVTVGILIRLK